MTAQHQRILAIGPSSGGVADAFSGSVAALRGRGLRVTEERPSRRGSAAVAAARSLWARRRSIRRADAVHVEFGSNDLAAFWFAWLAVGLRRPVVLVVHDPPKIAHAPGAALIAHGSAWRLRVAYRILSPLLDARLIAGVLRRAGAIVVLGEQARAELQARTARPVICAPHGMIRAGAQEPPSRCDYVLFAGYLGPGKGLDILLAAWRSLEHPDLRLVIAGAASPDHAGWAQALREQRGGHASPPQWLGRIDSERDFQRLFDRAAIVVLPYRRSSPASGILVRAMAAGRCVVATRVQAVEAVIEDGTSGVIVNAEDAGGLARELGRLAADGAERDRLGAQAALRAQELFGWDAHVDALRAAYGADAIRGGARD